MPAAPTAAKIQSYKGGRRSSRNGRGGLFDTVSSSPLALGRFRRGSATVDFCDWNPDLPQPASLPPATVLAAARRLSPIARYIADSLRRHKRWGPGIVADLSKLRRVTPDLVAEVLRSSQPRIDPFLASRFFHWAARQKGFSHTFASYNSFTYSLYRTGHHRAADLVPEIMHAAGKPPSEKQLEILVRLHADAGRGIQLYHLYRKMRKQFDIKPRVFLYNRILDTLSRTGHLDLALLVYEDLMADGIKEEAITFSILAKGFCRDGKVDRALELLEKMRKELCRPDVFAYTAMVKILVAKGDLNGSLRVWEALNNDGVVPDAMAYSTMVAGLCKDRMVAKGFSLFQEMKKRNFVIDHSIYALLIDGFVAEGKVGSGCKLLKDMVDDGYQVDLGIFDSLIGGLCLEGRADKAFKLFELVVREGLVPGFKTVSPLLAYYGDAGDMDSFFLLVGKLSSLGLPIVDFLSDFFEFFVEKGGRELKALEVFGSLKVKGHCSVEIYNIIIGSLHKVKELKKALLLFEEMKDSKEFGPNSSTYSLMIPCLVDDGDIQEACSCYNRLKEMSWTPSVEAYRSLVDGLCKMEDIKAALVLVNDCLGTVENGPMEFKYTLTIINACKTRKPEKVVEVLDEIIDQGCHIHNIVYCGIIHGFCKYASSTEARKVFALIRDRNILSESRYIVYEELLNEHLKKLTAGLVVSGLKFFGLESKLRFKSRKG